MFIKQVLDNKPKEAITAKRWNELWNLAITQGDHNSEIAQILCMDVDSAVTLLNSLVPFVEAGKVFKANHPTSADHDGRYYTKVQLEPMLRRGDTIIREEVFTIVNPNLGDGTFSYTNKDGVTLTGMLDAEGYQIFTLETGDYTPGENRMSAIVGDTLHRGVASGGLKEVDSVHIALSPEGAGAEITFRYFEKIGLAGEHNLTHEVGEADEVPGLIYVSEFPPPGGKAFWCKVVV